MLSEVPIVTRVKVKPMRTHMLSEVPIVKRVKVKPAGSATAGVSVSAFLFKRAGAKQVQSATHQELNFCWGGDCPCHSIWGHTPPISWRAAN